MKAPSPTVIVKFFKLVIAIFLIFSGAYMIFFPYGTWIFTTPLKEFIGFFVLLIGLWLLFKGAVV